MFESKKILFKGKGCDTEYLSYILISLFAIVFFVLLYGLKVLDFQNIDWLYGHYEVKEGCFYGKDLSQHYMGWLCYRKSDWTFPLGNMDLFSYPFETSVIYTDSIPLLALFFKILSPILPEHFQYFGLWAIICFVLQGIMASRLFRSYTKDTVRLVIGSLFFVIVPMLLWRTFIHSALCAHWIILMAMEPLVSKEAWTRRKLIIHYTIVGFFASMTAIYLLLFCGIILLGTCLRDIINTKSVVSSVSALIFYIGIAAASIAVMGGFSGDFASALQGLGIYSMNINSLLDSYGLSSLISEMPRYITENGDTQFEGYGYLGVGVLALIILSIGLAAANFTKMKQYVLGHKSIVAGVLFSATIAMIYALSPVVTFGDKKIIEIPLPNFVRNMWSIFRACGRGVWIVEYFLLFVVCLSIIKTSKKSVFAVSTLCCLLIQFFDCMPLYKAINGYFSSDIKKCYSYEALSDSTDFWESVSDNKEIKNVILANTTSPYDDEMIYRVSNVFDSFVGVDIQEFKMMQYQLGDYSLKSDKTFNYFRFSRHPYDRSRQYVMDRLSNLSEEDIFVFYDYNKFRGAAAGLNMYSVDGMYIGYAGELDARYKISSEDLGMIYYFGESEIASGEEVISLEPYAELKYRTMELPGGVYRVSIVADCPEQLEYSLSIGSDMYASILYSESADGIVYYYVLVEDETCRAYNVLINRGDKIVNLYAMQVNYIGKIEDVL